MFTEKENAIRDVMGTLCNYINVRGNKAEMNNNQITMKNYFTLKTILFIIFASISTNSFCQSILSDKSLSNKFLHNDFSYLKQSFTSYKNSYRIIGSTNNGCSIEGNAISNYLKQGHWKYHLGTGISIIGNYKNDKKIGNWYYINKKDTIAKLHFEDGKYSEVQESYYKNGNVWEQKIYSHSNNSSTTYDKNGNIILKTFSEGTNFNEIAFENISDTLYNIKFIGITPVYFISSKSSKSKYSGGIKHGTGELGIVDKEHNSKVIIQVKDSLLNGDYKLYHFKHLIVTGKYKNGYMDGTWSYYFMNKKISEFNCNWNDRKLFNIDTYLNAAKEYDLKSYNAIYNPHNHYVKPIYIPNNSDTYNSLVPDELKRYLNIRTYLPSKNKSIRMFDTPVIVSFTIDEIGEITNIKVISDVDQEIKKDIISVLKVAPLIAPRFDNNIPLKTEIRTNIVL